MKIVQIISLFLLSFIIPIALYQITLAIVGPSYFSQIYYWLTFILLSIFVAFKILNPHKEFLLEAPLTFGLLISHILAFETYGSINHQALSMVLLSIFIIAIRQYSFLSLLTLIYTTIFLIGYLYQLFF